MIDFIDRVLKLIIEHTEYNHHKIPQRYESGLFCPYGCVITSYF